MDIAVQCLIKSDIGSVQRFLNKINVGSKKLLLHTARIAFFVANKESLSLFCNYCPTPQHNMLVVLESVRNMKHT